MTSKDVEELKARRQRAAQRKAKLSEGYDRVTGELLVTTPPSPWPPSSAAVRARRMRSLEAHAARELALLAALPDPFLEN